MEARDSARLLAIFNANAHIGVWDPTFQVIEQAEVDGLVAASVSRRDSRGNTFQMQAVCERSGEVDGVPIGYYHMTFGAPQADLIWVSMFVLDPARQNQRCAGEVLAGLGREWRDLAVYRAARVEVWLKNWPALRLWAKAGFNQIVAFDGDKLLTPESCASVVLEQELVRSA